MSNNLDLSFKLNFKRILFSLIVGVLCTLTFSESNTYAFNSVRNFLNAAHQPWSAQLIWDTFYFCQGDTTPTTQTYYITIGFKVEVGDNVYTFSSPINYRQDGIPGLFNNVTEVFGDKTWDLWSINYHVLVNKLIERYPGVDFSDLYNRETQATFTFRGYVSYTENWGERWSGFLYADGSTSGEVYCNEGQPKPLYFMSTDSWNALISWNIIGKGGHYQKPDFPNVDTF